jgi:putative iron-only hydrogenase system regulator
MEVVIENDLKLALETDFLLLLHSDFLRNGFISFRSMQKFKTEIQSKSNLMEKRIGSITILIKGKTAVPLVNTLLSEYSSIILARQGLPLHNRNISVISLVIEGSTETISALTGKIGRLKDVEVKSILTRYKEEQNNEQE